MTRPAVDSSRDATLKKSTRVVPLSLSLRVLTHGRHFHFQFRFDSRSCECAKMSRPVLNTGSKQIQGPGNVEKMWMPQRAKFTFLPRRFEVGPQLLCAVRVPGDPVLTTTATCGTTVGSSLGSAGLPQWSQTQAYASNIYSNLSG